MAAHVASRPGCLQILQTMSLVQDDARCPLVKHLRKWRFRVCSSAFDNIALLLRCQY